MYTSVFVLTPDGSTGYLRAGTVNDILKYEPLGLLRMVEEIT
jgi:hypothetical protein